MLTLIVDDSKTVRMLLSLALKDMGATEVLEAESAERAEAILKICAVDLILTDWHMPGMSGLELLMRLRAQQRFKSIPIIMTTSESGGENVVAALKAGATNYLIKPFDELQLREKIGAYLKAASQNGSTSSTSLVPVSQSGALSNGDLGNVIQFLMQSGKTGRCDVEFAAYKGYIFFDHGRVVGAQHKSQSGEVAFIACVCGSASKYQFRELAEIANNERTITKSGTALLLDAAAYSDRTKGTN